MRSSYTKLYIHFIWGTWKRTTLIDKNLDPVLYRLITDRLIEHKCQLMEIGGTEDHIHILVRMHPSESVSGLAKSVKGYSSYTISNLIQPGSFFKWQGGYGAISVTPRDIAALSSYIAKQKEHHSNNGLKKQFEIDGINC